MTCVPCRTLLTAVRYALHRGQDDTAAYQRLTAHRATCPEWKRYAAYVAWFASLNAMHQEPR